MKSMLDMPLSQPEDISMETLAGWIDSIQTTKAMIEEHRDFVDSVKAEYMNKTVDSKFVVQEFVGLDQKIEKATDIESQYHPIGNARRIAHNYHDPETIFIS